MAAEPREAKAATRGGGDALETRAVRPSALGLALCVALGTVHALWSLFQWTQLAAARTGGAVFCDFGASEARSCITVFDSAIASTVQGTSGLPIAGWGVVWSLVAIAFPLCALARRGRQTEWSAAHDALRVPFWAAGAVTAGAGLVGAAIFVAATTQEGLSCTMCTLGHALVLSYALVTFLEVPSGVARSLPRGVSLASGAFALFYVLLFIPGLRTPEAGGTAIDHRLVNVRKTTPDAIARRSETSSKEITAVLRQLHGERLSAFVAALHRYRTAEVVALAEPRALIGAPNAPVRITTFSDTQCSACGLLHSTLQRIRTAVPPRSFQVEVRYFPLDPACNAHYHEEPERKTRCLTARARICLEGLPDANDFAANLLRAPHRLDEEGLYALAEPMITREALAACIASPETDEKLQSDIAQAAAFESIRSRPVVLLNGREVEWSGPLLYALIVAEGDATHPAFDGLPTFEEVEAAADERDVEARAADVEKPAPETEAETEAAAEAVAETQGSDTE